MQERIFALKSGTEVPVRFNGVTIPFQVPSTLADIVRRAGGDDAAVKAIAAVEAQIPETVRKTAVAIFNQADALNIQKYVKTKAGEDGATVDDLRKAATEHKYNEVRVRGGNTGAGVKKVKEATVATVLGNDFLSSLTPEQRAMYDAQMAKLRPQVAEATAGKTAENGGQTAEAPKQTGKKK